VVVVGRGGEEEGGECILRGTLIMVKVRREEAEEGNGL